MLPQNSRLPYAEFRARGYRTFSTPYFSLKVKPRSLPQNRIGVIISVAAVKSAVRRNFWKRQVKAILFGFQLSASKKTNRYFDFLLIFSKKGDLLTRAMFKKELSKTFASIFP